MGVRKWLEKSAEKQKQKLRKTLNPLSRKAFQAVSFSATKDMKNGCFRKKTTVFWIFKRIFMSAVQAQPETHSFASRFIMKKLEW